MTSLTRLLLSFLLLSFFLLLLLVPLYFPLPPVRLGLGQPLSAAQVPADRLQAQEDLDVLGKREAKVTCVFQEHTEL